MLKAHFKAGNKLPNMVSIYSMSLARIKRIEPLILVWWCLTLSILFASITRVSAELSMIWQFVFTVLGAGGCAWFWLFSCHLFRQHKNLSPKLFVAVIAVVFIEATAAVIFPVEINGATNEMARVLHNAASMICVTALVFVYYEAFCGFKEITIAAERRFRALFILGFSLLVGITVLWLSGAGANSFAAEWKPVLLTTCGLIASIGSLLAIQYRLKNPLALLKPSHQAQLKKNDVQQLDSIAQRILQVITDEAILTRPNLKVSEFAASIGEHEYKVTRSITQCLQFRNFNHLLNYHRIDRAKRVLNDPLSHQLTIATIAYDSGYNSLGPFNRAFRQHTGMTPREFRQHHTT